MQGWHVAHFERKNNYFVSKWGALYGNMTFWSQMSYFQSFSRKYPISIWNATLYTQSMKSICLEEICSHYHTIWKWEIHSPMMMSSHITLYGNKKIFLIWQYLLMVGVDILFDLYIKECMCHHICTWKLWRLLHYKIW